jgi:hypothetical protein
VTIFYCLRFETSLIVASYDSQCHGGGIRIPLLHGFWDLFLFLFYSWIASTRGGIPANIEMRVHSSYAASQKLVYLYFVKYAYQRKFQVETIFYVMAHTERGWHSGSALHSHSGGAWFESQLGQAILTENIRGFPQSFHANTGVLPRLGHGHFIPNNINNNLHHRRYIV